MKRQRAYSAAAAFVGMQGLLLSLPLVVSSMGEYGDERPNNARRTKSIGVSRCACQPSSYMFEFNFEVETMNPECGAKPLSQTLRTAWNENGEGGVQDFQCFSQLLQQHKTTDDTQTDTNDVPYLLRPVWVSSVTVLELDANWAPIATEQFNDGYMNGDSILYTSIAGTHERVQVLTEMTIPAAIQVNILGRNFRDEEITNVWVLLFQSECRGKPILSSSAGDVLPESKDIVPIRRRLGWMDLVSVTNPLDAVCPMESAEKEDDSLGEQSTTKHEAHHHSPSEPPTSGPTLGGGKGKGANMRPSSDEDDDEDDTKWRRRRRDRQLTQEAKGSERIESSRTRGDRAILSLDPGHVHSR